MTTLRILFWLTVGALIVIAWPAAIVFACAVGLIRDHRQKRTSLRRTSTGRITR